MKYCTYIIKSEKTSKYYSGSSEDINRRLQEHNTGKTKSTKSGIPWKLIYLEKFNTREEAYGRERKIKSYKGGNAFKKLINNIEYGEVA